MNEPNLLDFLNAFGSIATPVLVLILTAIGWNVRNRLQRRQELEDRLREDRISIYNDILEPFVIILTSDAAWHSDPKNKNKGKYETATRKMLSFEYRKTGFRMSLIGSDSVIRAYNELMQYFFKRQNGLASPSEEDIRDMMASLELCFSKSEGAWGTRRRDWTTGICWSGFSPTQASIGKKHLSPKAPPGEGGPRQLGLELRGRCATASTP